MVSIGHGGFSNYDKYYNSNKSKKLNPGAGQNNDLSNTERLGKRDKAHGLSLNNFNVNKR